MQAKPVTESTAANDDWAQTGHFTVLLPDKELLEELQSNRMPWQHCLAAFGVTSDYAQWEYERFDSCVGFCPPETIGQRGA